MRKLYYLFVIIFSLVTDFAEAKKVRPSDDLEKEVRANIEYKVKAFTDHFVKIAQNYNDNNIKDYHIEKCLDLLIGRGNDTKDDNGNVLVTAPIIEVSSTTTGKANSYFIKNYLARLKSLSFQDSKIAFKTVMCYVLEKINKEIGEGKYDATISVYNVTIQDYGFSFIRAPKVLSVILDDNSDFISSHILLGSMKIEQVY